MRLSNEQIYDLDAQALNAQFEVFSGLQTRHSARLIESGIVDRVIASAAICNISAPQRPINENTTLSVFRKTYGRLAGNMAHEVVVSCGLNAIVPAFPSLEWTPQAAALCLTTDPTYVLSVGRMDQVSQNTTESSGYVLGLQLSEEADQMFKRGGFAPIPGVTPDDMNMVKDMLAEVEVFASEHELSAVDSVTLSFGHGELVEV